LIALLGTAFAVVGGAGVATADVIVSPGAVADPRTSDTLQVQ
jgi:hypothetical protein